MENVTHDEVAEFLNESVVEDNVTDPNLYEAEEHYLTREGKSALGRSYAELLLDEFGIIVIKTVYMERNDRTRLWFAEVEVEEKEITKTVQNVTIE